jgi:hypothetical protein
MKRAIRPVVADIEVVEIDGQPVKVSVASPVHAPKEEGRLRQVLARVPAVQDLPVWEDGYEP